MFHMMNVARIAVGMQSLGMAEAAYRYAHQYALDRLQGGAIDQLKNPDAPRVAIVRHPDVRRMLLDMRSVVEGLRALLAACALERDRELAFEGAEPERAEGMLSLLTPLVKGNASEIAYETISTSMMVLGGHGYLSDHPIEQYVRDSIIARLYEGTTGIQALDLVGRKLNYRSGKTIMDLFMRIDAAVEAARGAGLDDLADAVAAMRMATGASAMGLGGQFTKGDFEGPLLQATPMLFLVGDAVMSWLHLRMATVAVKVDKQTEFHRNKVRTARHFILNAETRVAARAKALATADRSALDFVFEGES